MPLTANMNLPSEGKRPTHQSSQPQEQYGIRQPSQKARQHPKENLSNMQPPRKRVKVKWEKSSPKLENPICFSNWLQNVQRFLVISIYIMMCVNCVHFFVTMLAFVFFVLQYCIRVNNLVFYKGAPIFHLTQYTVRYTGIVISFTEYTYSFPHVMSV